MMTRSKRGFTIAEMLVVLAVLALLIAIPAPAFAKMSNSIKKKSLDSTATELFLLAQNHLAYMKSARSDKILAESDFVDGERAFFCFGEGCGSSLLPENALPSGNAVVVVDSNTLSATDAFYSQRLEADELADFAVADENVSINQYVGYYGGTSEVLLPRKNRLVPTLSVVNGDKLYIDFSCDISMRSNDTEYSAEVTLSCENGTYTFQLSDVLMVGDTLCGEVLIDEITADGGSYYMQEYAPKIGVGDSVLASVRIYQKSDGKTDVTSSLTAQEHALTFSPMFAEKSGSNVEIENARHLNNLRFLEASDEIHVSQTDDITFHEGLFPNGFEPLETFSGTFDGTDKLIINPKIRAKDGNVGIFNRISGYVKNVHIVGDGSSAACGGVDSVGRVGTLCAVAESGSVIENCSVSDLSLEVDAGDGTDVCIGGLVGEARGKIVRSSSACDISVSGNDSAKIGGIAGEIVGGTVEFSHSAGKLSLAENGVNSRVAGIAPGSGEVSHCYSECSAGYIGGAQFYGVASPETVSEDCYFIAENAWLAESFSGALSDDELKNLELTGFSPPNGICPLPESVTVNGVPTRFGEPHLADPRGLVGIVKITNESGEYINDVLACFDAYGNTSDRSPSILQGIPQDGAAYYLYRSVGAYPQKGEPMGWNCAFGGEAELGEESDCEGFVCQQILLGDSEVSAELSFGNVHRTVTLTGEQAGAGLGKIGVAAAVNHIESEFFSDIEAITEEYEYYYYFYDFVTDSGEVAADWEYGEGILGTDGITFARETEFDDEVKIYVFADTESERLLEPALSLDDMLGSPEEVDGIFYREWRGEWQLGERFSVTVDLGGRLMTVSVIIDMDWNGIIDVRMREGTVTKIPE